MSFGSEEASKKSGKGHKHKNMGKFKRALKIRQEQIEAATRGDKIPESTSGRVKKEKKR